MANRYWVNGTGPWNSTNTVNWSASSGGPSGASVPTASDSVFFDQAGAYFVNLTGAVTCLDLTVSAGTVSFASTGTLAISGSMSLIAGTAWTATGAITFNATTTGKTVTTNGIQIGGAVTFNGVGGGWTLGSAANFALNALTITNGAFSSGNYAITAGSISTANSNVRTIDLGSSTVTLSSATPLLISPQTNLTFNAGTSQINLTSTNVTGTVQTGVTFYNVAFTSTTASSTRTITGANTFNNLSVTAPSTAGVTVVTFAASQTINGALSTTGTAGNRRVRFAPSTPFGLRVRLVCNSAASLTDADFIDILVTGTAAPISGTRIGDLGNNTGITFSTPKTVYWNLAAGGNWSATAWATSSGGTVSTDNHPLGQDTAVIGNTGLNTSATITLDSALVYIGTLDLTGRTNAMTIAGTTAYNVRGSWKWAANVTRLYSGSITFIGDGTHDVISAGRGFGATMIVACVNGTVRAQDALIVGSNLAVQFGTLTTNNYAVSYGGSLISNYTSYVRTINLGSSVVTTASTSPLALVAPSPAFTFNAGTSTLSLTGSALTFAGSGCTFYNVTFTNTTLAQTLVVTGANTFNNLTLPTLSAFSSGTYALTFSADQTINGTFTCAGSSGICRMFISTDSPTTGAVRTITAAALSANDCDFAYITLAGAAVGTAPTRAGDCGGNSGITFPAPKTVYFYSTSSTAWEGSVWATSSGGATSNDNYPLPQDTAIIDNAATVATLSISSANRIGTLDATARTNALTLSKGSFTSLVYGDFKLGTGVTPSGSGFYNFSKVVGTQTIQSNGKTITSAVYVVNSATVQLADALTVTGGITCNGSGTLNAVSYNVTIPSISVVSASVTLLMGSGTWTLTSTGTVWSCTSGPVINSGTSTILLSDTSTTARTFAGGGRYYNKLTIGGTTGTSILTITGANTFGELASTKTVAHIILFPSSTTTNIGKWSVTGTAGNVVTVGPSTAATTYTFNIYGPANTGINYLDVSYCAVSTTSPGEFYVGVNSTNSAGNTGPIFFTATPSPRTLYWVGGTGNWSSTTKWSTSSGGASGAAIPTSLDSVVFNSASNATSYTATIDAGIVIARCASFTLAGPAAGTVSLSGSIPIAFHGSVSFAATGVNTNGYAAAVYLCGNSSYTLTTNGATFGTQFYLLGPAASWGLGSALNTSFYGFTFSAGTFSTNGYQLTSGVLTADTVGNQCTLNLGASTVYATNNVIPLDFGQTALIARNFTFNAGTSSLQFSYASVTIYGNGKTFYNVTFQNGALSNVTLSLYGANTFNNFTYPSLAAYQPVCWNTITLYADQTISGTMTLSGTMAVSNNARVFVKSSTENTSRTLTVNAWSASPRDLDFQDITLTGAVGTLSGTRFGDAGNNSGITFSTPKTVYWSSAGVNTNWTANYWASVSGGTPDTSNFPLPQDTAVFDANSGSVALAVTINVPMRIGTLDASSRVYTWALIASNNINLYGNLLLGIISYTGGSVLYLFGSNTQTISCNGYSIGQYVAVTKKNKTDVVQLGSAFLSNLYNLQLNTGTFTAGAYNVTAAAFASNNALVRVLNMGSGTWTLTSSGTAWNMATATNATVNKGTANIVLSENSTAAKTFAGGGFSYNKLTFGGDTSTAAYTISGNNIFTELATTKTVSFSLVLTTTVQQMDTWSLPSTSAAQLTLTGSSSSNPSGFVYTGTTAISGIDYATITNNMAWAPNAVGAVWEARANSTTNLTSGWIFSTSGTVYNVTISESSAASESMLAYALFLAGLSETTTAADTVEAAQTFPADVSETATATDSVISLAEFYAAADELAAVSDTSEAAQGFGASIDEQTTASETASAAQGFTTSVSEQANASDTTAAAQGFASATSEQATAADTTAASQDFGVAIAEQTNASDTASAAQDFGATVDEQANATDTTEAAQTFGTDITEAAAGVDTIASAQTFATDITETATGTDSTASSQTFAVTTDETATGSDAVTTNFTVNSDVAETATGTDTIASSQDFATDIAETAQGSDTIATAQTFATDVTEQVVGTDTIDAAQTFATDVAEQAAGADTVDTNFTVNSDIAEQAQAIDAAATNFTIYGEVMEQAQGTDTISSAATFQTAVDEQALGTDTIAVAQGFATAVSESAAASEVVEVAQGFNSNIAETATAADQSAVAASVFNPAVSETASASDTTAANYSVNSAVSETANASDTVSAKAIFLASLTELVTATDTVAAAQTFATSVSELGVASDVVAAAQLFGVLVSETATGQDSIAASQEFGAAVAELAAASDEISALRIANGYIEESSVASDSVDAPGSIYNAVMADTAAASDEPNSGATFTAAVQETLTVADLLFARYLWELVDDTQNPDWGNVTNTQTAGWANVDDTQSGNWQNVNNTASPGWSDVDNSQTTTWTGIQTN